MAAMSGLSQGMKVRSSDGANLGKIIQLESESFLVEKGFFSPKDYWIPTSLVGDIRDGEVWLSVSRERLDLEEGDARPSGMPGAGSHGTTAEGEHRMQLAEEELDARKRVREAGDVTVRKDVVTEHRQMDVPVTREEVRVERSGATGDAPQGEPFREQTIRVPVREEEVEVRRTPRVREEVRIAKGAHQEERRVEGDVRREEARVERSGEHRSPREEPED